MSQPSNVWAYYWYKIGDEWKRYSLNRKGKSCDILRCTFRIAIRYKVLVYCDISIYCNTSIYIDKISFPVHILINVKDNEIHNHYSYKYAYQLSKKNCLKSRFISINIILTTTRSLKFLSLQHYSPLFKDHTSAQQSYTYYWYKWLLGTLVGAMVYIDDYQ